MTNIGKLTDLGIVFSLLPGLLTFLVVHACTARDRKIDATEAILHGLAYTLLAHAIWTLCKMIGSLVPTPDIVGLPICAIFVGIVMSIAVNQHWIFECLRAAGVTSQPVHRSIWETSFALAKTKMSGYAIVELDDGRRVMGFVQGSETDQETGHICLCNCKWLTDDNKSTRVEGWVLFPAKRVKHILFLPKGNK